MKSSLRIVLAVLAIFSVGFVAFANPHAPQPTPSARLGIEVDVKPIEGKAGQFWVSSTVTDLENNSVIAEPRLVISADKPAKIEMGVEDKWMLQIVVIADGVSRRGSYDATFTREGKVVSRQRLAMNLNG
jgi:hypothetical protein